MEMIGMLIGMLIGNGPWKAAYASAGAGYKEIGRVDLAVESYEGALALVRMRKPDAEALVSSGASPGRSPIHAPPHGHVTTRLIINSRIPSFTFQRCLSALSRP